MSARVFVSYSHIDAALVGPLVKLLRATKDFVFQDADSLKAGKRWRYQIEEALRAATLIVVFWCRHSRDSTEVASECALARGGGKDILPLLLDNTPLPTELAEYQWVDFRHLVLGSHETLPPRASMNSPIFYIAAAIAVLAVAVSSLTWGDGDPLILVAFLGLSVLPAVALVRWLFADAVRKPGRLPFDERNLMATEILTQVRRRFSHER